MDKKFSIMDLMSDTSKNENSENREKISIFDIQSNSKNFYNLGRDKIEEMKNSIIELKGVQHNVIVVRLPESEQFKYRLISGHRRVLASAELVREGHDEFTMIPALIKNNIDADEEELLLIMTNSTQRELSDYEKVMQHIRLKELYTKLKSEGKVKGKIRSFEAESLKVSESQIAIYNTIGTKLENQLMDLFADEVINISLAYEIAKLAPSDQIDLIDVYEQNGKLTNDDVNRLLYSKPLEGQVKVEDIVTEDIVTEDIETTVTFEMDAQEETISFDIEPEENVSESDTFETVSAADINVSESDTSDKQTAVEQAYTVDDIQYEIEKYEGYLKQCDKDKFQAAYKRYSMTRDALQLLLDSMR